MGTSPVLRIYVTPNILGRELMAGNLLRKFFLKFIFFEAKIRTWVRMLIRVSSEEQKRKRKDLG